MSYLGLRLGIMLTIVSLSLILFGVNVWVVLNLVKNRGVHSIRGSGNESDVPKTANLEKREFDELIVP